MAKVILICGKLCSGKTTYSRELSKRENAVVLSSDELISALFHPKENDYHDGIIDNVHGYLLKKTVELLKAGANVILEWGFWTRSDRARANELFSESGAETEWHYLSISDDSLRRNIEKRNKEVLDGKSTDYYVDEGLLSKLESMFEPPEREEMDVWIEFQPWHTA